MALRQALLSAPLYRNFPGYEAAGAVTVSTFIVAGQSDAEDLAAGEGYETFGLAAVGRLRGLGYEVVATDVFEDGVPVPFSDRHVDVVVCRYPEGQGLYEPALPKAARKKVREELLPLYKAALNAFEPRVPSEQGE